MLPYSVSFDSPGWLVLLALLPLMWWLGRRSLTALGRLRRWTVVALRSVVFVLLVLALAEVQIVRTSERLTVVYLLDQSLSIPREQRQAMIEYVNAAIGAHRREGDRAGVIVYGREAAIEIPPFDDDVQLSRSIESPLDPEHTNLADALKLAQAAFAHDSSRRVVIVSDGNENLGDALAEARAAAAAGVGFDVVPVQYGVRADVSVEKVVLPADVREGEPFDLRIVVNNTAPAELGAAGAVRGQLRVSVRTGDQPLVLSDETRDVPPGKSVFTVRQEIDKPSFYTYEATFIPEDADTDSVLQNNQASAFTLVRGTAQVLLIEDISHRGEHEQLVDVLKNDKLDVTVRTSNQLFTNLAELQQYDTVVLADVPRSGGENAGDVTHFSDEQIAMLVQHVESLGAGLVMLGGPDSFGAGGWTNTELEKAMPVDFTIKSARVVPKGALALIMHASEMPEGNFWQKKIAQEAVKALGTEDYCGLIHWDGTDSWLWGGMIRVGNQRNRMLGAIDRMTPGDMPQFDPALRMAALAFRNLKDAAAKHMIVISDGDPSPPSAAVKAELRRLRVTVSTVAVASHGPAESKVMEDLALATGGKYYQVQNPRALPKIFQREARRVARPLVFEDSNGFTPRLKYPHEITAGLEEPLPPLTGFVMTTVKDNPLVEVLMVSPKPSIEANATLLACWQYGLGRTVAWTSDDGARWAKAWSGTPQYDKLFSQMVRWSLRRDHDHGNFIVSTDAVDGKIKVVVTALDKDDQFLNFLDATGLVISPGMKSQDLRLEQTAPGRYVGEVDAAEAGSYFVVINPGPGMAPVRAGVNVPYAAEFAAREADRALLTQIAALTPAGGDAGRVIEGPDNSLAIEPLLEVDTFRHDLPKALSSQDVWPLLLFAAGCLFFVDVFARRVTVSLAWAYPYAARLRDRLLGREAAAPVPEYMQRLRSKKAEVSEQLQQRQAAARFEAPTVDQPADTSALDQELSEPGAAPVETRRPQAPPPKPEPEQEGYTSRLLKAKKKVWEERDQEKP